MESLQNLMQNLTLFSSLSGLSFEHIHPDKEKHCADCLMPAVSERACVTIMICKNGFCHLSLSLSDGVLFSSPVSFSSFRVKTSCGYTQSPVHHMSPATFYKTAKLFSFTFTGREISPLAARLSAELSCSLSSTSMAQSFIRNALSEILTQNGNHFFQNKQDVLCFILSLHEIAESYGGAPWKENWLSALAGASSIGQLASCIDSACTQFIKTVFPAQNQKHTELVQNACLFISQNYQKRLTQNEVARAIYVSPPYFSKIFKDAMGCGFNQYVNRLRIAKAKELLATPHIEIEDIATMTGYESRSYFGKVFRQLTGQTPREYRDSVLPK